jgi:hypothetical protein
LHAFVAGVCRHTAMGKGPLRAGMVGLDFAKHADVYEDAAFGLTCLPHDFILGLVCPETTAYDDGGLATVLECRQKFREAGLDLVMASSEARAGTFSPIATMTMSGLKSRWSLNLVSRS